MDFPLKRKQRKHFLVPIGNCCNAIASKKRKANERKKLFYPKNIDLGNQIRETKFVSN